MTQTEALKLALEALEAISGSADDPNNGWRGSGTDKLFTCEYCKQMSEDCSKIPHLHECPVPKAYPAITAIKEALAQPEQELVGEVVDAIHGAFKCNFIKALPVGTKLYTAPPQLKPLEPVEGDLLPAIGSKVLIYLARQDEWVEHAVVGYYVLGGMDRDERMHRVFVRVVDADGILNARMLRDVRPVEAAHGIKGDA